MKITNVGIAGCGAIGSKIAQALVKEFKGKASLCGLYDIDYSKSRALAARFKKTRLACGDLKDLIKRADFIVEAASVDGCADILRQALRHRRSCLVMSAGGLLNNDDIIKSAKRNGCKVYVPSGAICGIDGLKAHKLAGIKKVTLTTIKPFAALSDKSSLIKGKGNDTKENNEFVVFEGSAREAVTLFPRNINVAATLSLAGIGKEKTLVRIIASKNCKVNTHKIEIESAAGRVLTVCENIPCPDNPKTSYLAVLSAITLLKRLFEPVSIGS